MNNDKTMFEKYFQENVEKNDKLYYNFLGISRKEYPKWEGWKIIKLYKEKGIDIRSISDPKLDLLVRNHYYVKYIQEKYLNKK